MLMPVDTIIPIVNMASGWPKRVRARLVESDIIVSKDHCLCFFFVVVLVLVLVVGVVVVAVVVCIPLLIPHLLSLLFGDCCWYSSSSMRMRAAEYMLR